MMTEEQLKEFKKRIAPVVNQSNVSYVALFGSYARGEGKEGSDVDLLVRFSKPIDFIEFIELEENFSKHLGKKVDLVTEKSLSPYLKPYVLKDLKTLYEG